MLCIEGFPTLPIDIYPAMAEPVKQCQQRVCSPAASGTDNKFSCSHCPRSFKRMEHLKRHRRIHDGSKRFICPTCAKGFARSDILHRHELIHTAVSGDPTSSRRKRACIECARARERCTKGTPCSRCSSKSLECTYPQESSEKRPVAPDEPAAPAQSEWEQVPTQYHSETSSQYAPIVTSPLTASPEGLPEAGSLEAPTVSSPFQSSTEAHSALASYSEGGNIDDCSGDVELTSPSELPGSILGLFKQSRYMAPNPFLGYHQPVGYQQPTPSSMIWIPTTQPSEVGYDPAIGLAMVPYPYQESLHLSPYAPDPMAAQESTITTDEEQRPYVSSYALNQPALPLIQASMASPIATVSPISQPSVEAIMSTGAFIEVAEPLQSQFNTDGLLKSTSMSADDMFSGAQILSFPSLESIPVEQHLNIVSVPKIQEEMYGNIIHYFHSLCLNSGGTYRMYLSSNFPSASHMDYFVHLYFQHFNPILPVIHERLVEINSFWPLTLAMCTIGCQYANTPLLAQCAGPFREFLRRAVVMQQNTEQWTRTMIPLAQTLILNQISLRYNDSSHSAAIAQAEHRSLLEILGPFGLLRESQTAKNQSFKEGEVLESRWLSWLRDETRRRLGYAIWLLDSMSAYHLEQRPLLCLDAAQCTLPRASLWAARTAREWARASELCPRNPTLPEAVNSMMFSGEVQADLGDFGRTILLYGLCDEAVRARGFFANPLSPHSGQFSLRIDGLPRLKSEADALSCVEVLHREETASITRAGSVESPIILHLHMARLVLLAPYSSIQTLAKSATSQLSRYSILRSEVISAEQEVFQWAQQDEQSARLAVLHCGLFYWHIRRYSRDAYYEPVSVFLATLTLWAYSSYVPQPPLPLQGETVGNINRLKSRSVTRQTCPDPLARGVSMCNTQPEPTFIRLDRPNDEEMAQLFVISGRPSVMRAYVTGVGNIYSPYGAVNILREGRKILGTVSSAWGQTQEYVSVLEALERTTVQRMGLVG